MKLYGLILALALIIRFWGLGLNPIGISHDEIHDLINAKSLAILGQSAPGTAAGIFTQNPYCDGNCIFGELVSYLLIPWMAIFPLGIVASKIPFLLASLGIVYFGGKFFENITNKKEIGLLTSLLLAINPWAVHFGRTAFENIFSFFFFLFGLYLFTKKNSRHWYLISATFLCFLGFLSYFGAKPIFVFLVLWGIYYSWEKNNFKHLKLGLILIFISAVITIGYLLILKNSHSAKRFGEITTNHVLDATSVVNEERRMSLDIPIIRDLVVNKYLVTGKFFLDKFLGAFSPIYLFSRGEQGYDVFMISDQSYLYLIDGVFIVLGLMFLGTTGGGVLYLLPLIVIVTIPTIISVSGTTYGLRSGLLFPLLCGLAAMGIIWARNNLRPNLRHFFSAGVVGIYLLSFVYFQSMYWYRTPFEMGRGWFFHERALVKYLSLLRSETLQKVIVNAENPVDMMYNYAFYTGKYNDKHFALTLNQAVRSGNYQIDDITFIQKCSIITDKNVIYIWERSLGCTPEPNGLRRISEAKDGGARFFFPNESLCQGIKLNSFPYPRNITDFSVEKMNRDNFCKMWVSQP
jgi:hypothetical protein